MKESILVDTSDIKKILAEKFNVPIKNVIKTQYSYTVILEKQKEERQNENS